MSFTGGPRHLHECTQDFSPSQLILSRKKFEENFYLVNILKIIFGTWSFPFKIKNIYGSFSKASFHPALCHMYTVEWWKRGLLHADIALVRQKNTAKPSRWDYISAELPNPNNVLCDIVKTHVVYGPSGHFNQQSPWMKNKKCSKDTLNPLYLKLSLKKMGVPFIIAKVHTMVGLLLSYVSMEIISP